MNIKMGETFCKLLEKAITDEKEAIKGYEEFQEKLMPGIASILQL